MQKYRAFINFGNIREARKESSQVKGDKMKRTR